MAINGNARPLFDPYTGRPLGDGNQQSDFFGQNGQNQGYSQPMNYGMNNMNMNNQRPRFFEGRPVESIEVLRTMEIPFDGNPYYFPKADGTEVFRKRWLPNGSTETVRYVVKTEEDQQAEENRLMDAISAIDERLNNLQNQIGMMFNQGFSQNTPQQQQPYYQKKPNPNKKPNKNYQPQNNGGQQQ